MIKISFNNISFDKGTAFKDSKAGNISITVEGHSGFGKKGEDPVCAAVSALSHTFIASVVNILRIIPNVIQRDGYEKVEVELTELPDEKKAILKNFLDFFCIGILEIESNYEETINIKFE